MNQCTSCGFQNADGSNFCKKCGTKLQNNVIQRSCFFCGKKAPQGTLFCTACGKPLEESMKQPKIQIEPTHTNIQSDEVTFSRTEQAPKKKTGIIILVIVLLLAIILVAVGIVFAQKNAKDDKTNEKKDIKNEQLLDDDEVNHDEIDREDIVDKSETEIQEDFEEEQISEEQLEENVMVQDANYILPESNLRMLTISDLYLLTAEECRLARNEIYARHGRKFNDESLKIYFESKDWYLGTIEPEDFNESTLSEIEVANRDLIVQYETMRGYN